jgi:hypothetical protein
VRLIERIARAEADLAARDSAALREARATNERDRTVLHRIVRQVDDEITGRMWLIEGRGAYEWDDDRYRQEFGWAVKALQEKLEPLRKIAGDLSHCPTTQNEVDKARAPEASQDLAEAIEWWKDGESPTSFTDNGLKLFINALVDAVTAERERIRLALETANELPLSGIWQKRARIIELLSEVKK